MKCPDCEQDIPRSAKFCPRCGIAISTGKAASASSPIQSTMEDALSASALSDPAFLQASLSGLPTTGQPEPSPIWRKMRSLFKMRSRPTKLEGVIVNLQTQQEDPNHNDILTSFFRLLKDIVWPGPEQWAGGQKKIITVIRLRTPTGAFRDARLEGEPGGALLVVGDNLSLWGRYWRGTFIVQRGCNNTSEAEIFPKGQNTPLLLLLLLLLVLIAIIFIASTQFHIPHLPFPPYRRTHPF